jgi:hypothetical protein
MLPEENYVVVQLSPCICASVIFQFFKPEVSILVIPTLTWNGESIFSQNWQQPLLITSTAHQP